jgi:transcriptional regulator with PAS, ATPase and Fis domain
MGRSAASDEIVSAERLLSEVFNNANVGLAILDDQFRYVALNPRLAAINGASVESHLGKTRREILGDFASLTEPAYKQVLATARPVLNIRVKGELPRTAKAGDWIVSLFPVTDSNGRVTQVWSVVTEILLNRRLEQVKVEDFTADRDSAILRSWKEIAGYVGACVKTVQRWEQVYGLPIRRLKRSKGAVVFALRDEVDGWIRTKPQT